MSRIGKIPVAVPKEVKINVHPSHVHMEGPKGKLDLNIPHGIKVEFKDGQLLVTRTSDTKQNRANHGTIRAHLVNIVEGVTKGHRKDLELQGVGFRAQIQGKKIILSLGLSHPIEFDIPDTVKVAIVNQTAITVEGADITSVGQIAASMRALKPAEPYKGKGVRYLGEVVKRKQGNSVTK